MSTGRTEGGGHAALALRSIGEQARADAGTLHPSRTLMLRVHVGTAESDDGTKYTLSVNAAGYAPIVHSDKTGRWFTLSWQDIVDLAIAKGIDAPQT